MAAWGISMSVAMSGPAPTEVRITEVLQELWRLKLLFAALTFAAVIAALVGSWLAPDKYEASIILSPVTTTADSGQMGALGSIASEFGGLASLAGISLGADTKRAEALAILQSQALTEKFIASNDLLPVLYADDWDSARKQWRVD